jgi:hypothetical protein
MLRPFRDVPESHLNYEAILYLQANGVVQGKPDGGFWPEDSINRAEFTKILVESIAEQNVIETCLQNKPALFIDTPGDAWFGKYVCVAKKFGMAYGNPDGTYRPANAINFAEAATLLARNLGLQTAVPKPEALWYKPFVEAMERKSAIPLSINHFAKPITRAEMAEMIYRIQANIPPKPTQTYSALEKLSAVPYVSPVQRLFPFPSSSSSQRSNGVSSSATSSVPSQSAASSVSAGSSQGSAITPNTF